MGFLKSIELLLSIFDSLLSLLWFAIMLSAVVSAVYVIMQFFNRYIERPLVTSIERDYYAWNTTFPSFTLCSQNKINETELEIYLE